MILNPKLTTIDIGCKHIPINSRFAVAELGWGVGVNRPFFGVGTCFLGIVFRELDLEFLGFSARGDTEPIFLRDFLAIIGYHTLVF